MPSRLEKYGFNPSIRFSLKCYLERSPAKSIMIVLTILFLIIAYLLRIFEIEYYRAIGFNDFEQFYSAIWAVVITMATVGFGDVVPVSHVGRLIVIVTSILSTFLFTLVIAAFKRNFILTEFEKRAMHDMHIYEIASKIIA